jgi:hypothetical protein
MPIPTQPAPAASTPAKVSVATQSLGSSHDGFEPVAGLLACVFPGLGHFFLGEKQRAMCIAAGVLSLFFGGMLIGGIDVIDSKEDTIWFAGQALVGPIAFGVDYIHQNNLKVVGPTKQINGPTIDTLRTAYPEQRDADGKVIAPAEARDPRGKAVPAAAGQLPPNSKSLGRMNELGTLFATIAGMLNLIVIIDALLHTKHIPVRGLGLKATLADAESPLGAPQSIDPSVGLPRDSRGGSR